MNNQDFPFFEVYDSKPAKTDKKKNVTSNIGDDFTRHNDDAIPTDVLGSYTGMTYDGEAPTQDADDL